ncbi:MAG: hypothetical protein JWQ54_3438 [Mucilaginibacter sp.]|nr:hypothetical protein [Mucilaginibacter sp.]
MNMSLGDSGKNGEENISLVFKYTLNDCSIR